MKFFYLLIGPWIQTDHISITNLFSRFGMVVQLCGIGSSTIECFSGIQGHLDVAFPEEIGHFRVRTKLPVDVTFPDFSYIVSIGLQVPATFEGSVIFTGSCPASGQFEFTILEAANAAMPSAPKKCTIIKNVLLLKKCTIIIS